MSKKKHPPAAVINVPPAAMIKDLKAVFEKHNWSGAAVGLRPATAEEAPDICPNGNPPQMVTVEVDGQLVTRRMCL